MAIRETGKRPEDDDFSRKPDSAVGSELEDRRHLHRWFSVVSVWICWLMWGGILKALGVMLPVLTSQFTAGAWLIGWIVAMADGMIDLSGPLGRRFGSGRVVMVSGLMIGGALIVTSFASSTMEIAALLTTFLGCGLGVAMVLSRAKVAYCFTQGYSTATAIGQTGCSLALIIFAPLTQLFLDTYGWRGTMLLLGGISLHIIVSGALISASPELEESVRNMKYQSLPTSDGSTERCEEHKPNGTPSKCSSICCCQSPFSQSVMKDFNFELFFNFRYWVMATVMVCVMFALELWIVYFVSMCQAKGFSPKEAGYFVLGAGIGSLCGKAFTVLSGCCTTRVNAGFNTFMLAMSLVLSSIPLMLLPFVHTYWVMMVQSFAYFCAVGTAMPLGEVVMKELLGPDRLASAFGWVGIKSGLLRIALGFFPGWIYDYSGSYDISFVILGCIQLIGVGALILMKLKNHHGN